jgi:hypothetical protein
MVDDTMNMRDYIFLLIVSIAIFTLDERVVVTLTILYLLIRRAPL